MRPAVKAGFANLCEPASAPKQTDLDETTFLIIDTSGSHAHSSLADSPSTTRTAPGGAERYRCSVSGTVGSAVRVGVPLLFGPVVQSRRRVPAMDVVRQAYGAMAKRYIELFANSSQVHADDLAFIAKHLSIRPGAVIDVGCGPGHLTEYLRSFDVDATGIDLVPEFISTLVPPTRTAATSLAR
jgi:hypothetical protein